MRLATQLTIAAPLVLLPIVMGQGCLPPAPSSSGPVFNNTTDRTNGGASYIGSAACQACHPDIAQRHQFHGHSHVLNRIEGAPPQYPAQASRAGVPNPPQGFAWNDISYVIGGYIRKANLLDSSGFLITTGSKGVNAQWNLLFNAAGTTPGYVPYQAGNTARMPYDVSCFTCHTTGPAALSAANPISQDNRPGILGTWQESGGQCEACHGPGSNHIPNPAARNIFADNSAAFCGTCHTRTSAAVIQARSDGFIDNYQQYSELLASGGHASFSCGTCHDPHAGTNYDRGNALRNTCTSCHPDKTLGLHAGKKYAKGDYVEQLSCESCHMPFATASANAGVVGTAKGRVGDMRTHLFRINTDPVDYTRFFDSGLTQVVKDNEGRAAVTVDFVCLRCHSTENGFPFALTIRSASEIARGIHQFQ